MDTGEQLAAYLSDDLDAAQRQQVEAALARDPQLRARLEAIRRTDEALADLPGVGPSPAFVRRLHAAVNEEVGRQHLQRFRPPQSTARAHRSRGGHRGDGRTGRQRPWVGAAAAAAVLIAVAGVGVIVSDGLRQGDGALETVQGTSGAATTTEGVATLEADAAEDGPVVVAAGRDLASTDLAELAEREFFDRVTSRRLSASEAAQVAGRYRAAFGVNGPDTGTDADRAAAAAQDDGRAASGESAGVEAAPEGAAPGEVPPGGATLQVQGDVAASDLAAVRACLPLLLDQDGIPVYAELGSYDGEPAVLYGLVSEQPDGNTFARAELWIVDRDTCTVRQFEQPGG